MDFFSSTDNYIFDYVKFVLYGTDDKELLEEKERGLKFLFEGIHHSSQQKFDIASKQIQKAIDIFEKTNDELSKAFAFFFMAQNYNLQEDTKSTKDYYEKAYQIFKEKGNMMALHIEQKLLELKLKK